MDSYKKDFDVAIACPNKKQNRGWPDLKFSFTSNWRKITKFLRRWVVIMDNQKGHTHTHRQFPNKSSVELIFWPLRWRYLKISHAWGNHYWPESRTRWCHYSDQFKSVGDWAETKPQKWWVVCRMRMAVKCFEIEFSHDFSHKDREDW